MFVVCALIRTDTQNEPHTHPVTLENCPVVFHVNITDYLTSTPLYIGKLTGLSAFIKVGRTIWGHTHERTDDPPPVPMFGTNRPCVRPSSGNLGDALTEVAG